jgi:GntR family transcriptional regulator/MocR family aminotransferase
MLRPWSIPVALDANSDIPMFLQIARAISDDIRRGRLTPDDPLPGTRRLAAMLGVHRKTVVAAFEELEVQGWVVTQEGRGTFVAPTIPDIAIDRVHPFTPIHVGMPVTTGFQFERVPVTEPNPPLPPGSIEISDGVPDSRLAPMEELARSYRRVLRNHRRRSALGYLTDPRGSYALRSALSEMLNANRGIPASTDNICITRGSQMALFLVARTLVRSGDIVAVENPGYHRAWDTFRLAGAEVVPVEVDDKGMSIEVLEGIIQTHRLRAVYVTPHHQYPTTVSLAPERRKRLLALAAEHHFAIIEDDYDHDFYYSGRPMLPMASAEPHGVVIYVGTLSKVLAPGIRIGYIAAPAPLIEQMALLRMLLDGRGDSIIEHAIAELFESGEIARYARRMQNEYRARRDALADELCQRLHGRIEFDLPSGGLAIWVRLLDVEDAEGIWQRAAAEGVLISSPGKYSFDGRAIRAIRLGFAGLTIEEIQEVAGRLEQAIIGRV